MNFRCVPNCAVDSFLCEVRSDPTEYVGLIQLHWELGVVRSGRK